MHRKFTGFVLDGAEHIPAGTKIVVHDKGNNKEVGEITSSASMRMAGGERTVALGYIRREVGIPGKEVGIGPAKATVVQLPIEEAALSVTENTFHQISS